jgi:hypothetical protein
MDDSAYYQYFENNLKEELVKMCTASGFLAGKMLNSEDIDLRWTDYAPNYLADAMPQIAEYPTVAVAWAAYVGMAVAKWWDQDWETFGKWPYENLHGKRGFDDMDEHIVREVLGLKLDSEEAAKIEEIIRQCATTAITFIRHENVEPQTQRAFYLFARSVKVMYEIGAAMQLKRLGYKWNKAF